jgi:diacylglycerol kinase family enzyme
VRATLIHNPTAGDGKPGRADIEAIVRAAGFQVRYQSSKKDWKKALKGRSDLVIVAGGDGTVAKVMRALGETGRPVAVLPIGTANNIARTVAALGDARVLAESWRTARPSPFDVGVAADAGARHLFVEGAGGGLFADAIAAGKEHVEDSGTILGSETDRALSLMRDIAEKAVARQWRVEVDGEDHSGEYLAVEAMNIRHVGPSVPIAPNADPGDGRLDVVFVRPSDRRTLLTYLDNRLEQHEVRLPELTVRQGSRVMLTASGGRLRVDDSLLENRRRLEISLMAGAVQIVGNGAQSGAGASRRKEPAKAG